MKRHILAVLVFLQARSYHLGPFSSSESNLQVGQIDVRVSNPEIERALARAAASAVSSRRHNESEPKHLHLELVHYESRIAAPGAGYYQLSMILQAKTDSEEPVTVRGTSQYRGDADPEQSKINQAQAIQRLSEQLVDQAVVRLVLQNEARQ